MCIRDRWYGHVSRSSGLAKTILQGTVKGGRKQGRQRKRWEDVREWTGIEFAKSQTAVENRGKWRKLVAKSSVVPKRPLRSRDRWNELRECLKGKCSTMQPVCREKYLFVMSIAVFRLYYVR